MSGRRQSGPLAARLGGGPKRLVLAAVMAVHQRARAVDSRRAGPTILPNSLADSSPACDVSSARWDRARAYEFRRRRLP